ncbi:MAG TPA: acetylornithine transaminase [Actinomycetales bacterium]|nr:acetylornithine transaminase [Actinomycetales bacterium]
MSEQWLERYANAVMGTYGTPQRVLVRGEGCYVWDADGRRYLDLLAGIATNLLGHAHPALVDAVGSQLSTMGHVSNFFASPVQVELAERLVALLHGGGGARVFFCNSGAEANEAAFKIARRTGRSRVVAAEGGFHGRTMGALSLTHKPAIREPFVPLVPGVDHVPFGDVAALEAAVDETTAAVILEPVQGEAGVRPAPDGYLAAARRLTSDAGALLVLDEVQTGIGRTGAWFAHQLPGLGLDGSLPDVVTLAKGLGGGIPVGAAVALTEPAATLLGAGAHGTTFGGNPVAAAAALATLDAVEHHDLIAAAVDVGALLRQGIEALGHPLVTGVRGAGLLLAVQLAEPVAAKTAHEALDAGFIVNPVAPDAVRLAPPLVLSADQAREFTAALPGILDVATPPGGTQ